MIMIVCYLQAMRALCLDRVSLAVFSHPPVELPPSSSMVVVGGQDLWNLHVCTKIESSFLLVFCFAMSMYSQLLVQAGVGETKVETGFLRSRWLSDTYL